MAVTCTEKPNSRRVTDSQSAELYYIVSGTADEVEALTALNAGSPTSFQGLLRRPVEVEPVHIDENNPDNCIWDGTATYVLFDYQPPDTGSFSFSFNVSGGTQHITQSIKTVHAYAEDGTPPDFKGAIGVTKDGVEGTDIIAPTFEFSETHVLPSSQIDYNYVRVLALLRGRVNDRSFKGLAAGECLFLNASGSKRGTGNGADWEMTYNFAGSQNRKGLTIGAMTGIEKRGWEYLWVYYREYEDDASHRIIQRPFYAYVEQVYEYGNFGLLGIGT